MNVEKFLSELAEGQKSGELQPGDPVCAAREELILGKRGRMRQAGATEGTPSQVSGFIDKFRTLCERDLYSLCKGVLRLTLLTESLHRPFCRDFWARCNPKRKLGLLPRDHLKSSITGRGLPIHIAIQPRNHNIYFPGCQDKNCRHRRRAFGAEQTVECDDERHLFDGRNTRILLAYETATNAQSQLRWIAGQFSGNPVLRRLWPDRVWENAKQESPAWNQERIIIPRDVDEAQPTIDTAGVGGATVSRHYNCHIFDDLFTLEAANSVEVAYKTVEWFKASRAMLDDQDHSLEWIVGTRWAPKDLYEYIIEKDKTVAVVIRAAIEGGQPIFPEMFSLASLERLRQQLGPMFYLLYMNSAADESLTDFNMSELREYKVDGFFLDTPDDDRDATVARRYSGEPQTHHVEEFIEPDVADMGEAVEALSVMDGARDFYYSMKYGRTKAA